MTDAQTLSVWIAQAAQHANAGDLVAAKTLCEKILAVQKNYLPALQVLGQVELRLNKFGAAIAALRRALEISPENKTTQIPLGMALSFNGNYDEGIEILEQVLRRNPQANNVYLELVNLYRKTGALARGIDVLSKVHGVVPNSPDILVSLSILYRVSGQLDKAVAFGEKAVAAAPGSWLAKQFLAAALLNRADYERAAVLLKQCLSSESMSAANRAEVTDMLADTVMVSNVRAYMNADEIAGGTVPHDTWPIARNDWERGAVAALLPQLEGHASEFNVVFFHVDWPGAHPFLSAAGNVDYQATLLSSCDLARRAYANASVMVLTDRQTDMSFLPSWVRVLRVDADAGQMMYSRMCAYRALLMTRKLSGPVLFLDTDVCLVRDVRSIFDGTFDVGLTFRTQHGIWHMPINEGVIMVAEGALEKGAQFFGQCLNIYEWLAEAPAAKERYNFSIKKWRGGQLSLAAFMQWSIPPFATPLQTVRGIRVRFFDGDAFNYPVAPPDTAKFLKKKWAVHFKGAIAKDMMAAFQAELRTG